MKKITKVIIVALLIILGLFFMARLLSPEDTWICVNNQWVKHGNPSSLQPETGCKSN